jgi:hypothetical protein
MANEKTFACADSLPGFTASSHKFNSQPIAPTGVKVMSM